MPGGVSQLQSRRMVGLGDPEELFQPKPFHDAPSSRSVAPAPRDRPVPVPVPRRSSTAPLCALRRGGGPGGGSGEGSGGRGRSRPRSPAPLRAMAPRSPPGPAEPLPDASFQRCNGESRERGWGRVGLGEGGEDGGAAPLPLPSPGQLAPPCRLSASPPCLSLGSQPRPGGCPGAAVLPPRRGGPGGAGGSREGPGGAGSQPRCCRVRGHTAPSQPESLRFASPAACGGRSSFPVPAEVE